MNITDDRLADLVAGTEPTTIERGTLDGLFRFGAPRHREAARTILRRDPQKAES